METESKLFLLQKRKGNEKNPMAILNTIDTEYKANSPDAKPLRYGPEMKYHLLMLLNEIVIPLDDELR